MTRRLFVFTNAFPFGTWEPFLHRETEFYSGFDEVYIFSLSVRPEQLESCRVIDPRIIVVSVPFRNRNFYAVRSLRLLANPEFLNEIKEISKKGSFTVRRFIQAAAFFSRADYEASVIADYIVRNIEARPQDTTVLYSYRFLYQPYVMSKVAGFLPNPRLVSRAHGSDLYEDVSPTGYLPYREKSLKALDRLSLISKHGLRYVRDSIPGFESKLSLDYLGTEDLGVASYPRSRKLLRIVTCSSIVAVKRLGIVVEALAGMPEGTAVEWTHYGDGPEMSEMRDRAASLPSHVKVNFKGSMENRKILEEYSKGLYHVLVNTSESEGLPVSIMEAASFGIPAIATDVGGTSEIVRPGLNGFLLAKDLVPEQLRERLIYIIESDDSEYLKLREMSRKAWERSFNSAQNYKNFVDEVLLDGNVLENGEF